MSEGTRRKLEFCMAATKECLDSIRLVDKRGNALLRFAKDYFSDAQHYAKKGNEATALEAAAYAHGFIDSLVLLGFAEIPGYHLKKSA
ncbi:DUF357 domain-containing protein [Candidatus Micrarchaeota archaeon]|nr:DUF357 domain-containing protein [Candidatus Micrarchaeota archaeon]